MADIIRFQCVKEGSRLRVRILSPGYNHEANCQFPRAIRAAGQEYTAPRAAVTFAEGPNHRFFYRVRASSVALAPALPPAELRVYTDESIDCSVCMEEPKSVVFAPCGHYYCCLGCATQIHHGAAPNCPICRAPIGQVVPRDMID
jgi:hypothetical protein